MKWNTEQLELGLNPYRNNPRSMQRFSQRRLQRASWWFEQMRKAVDNAESWPEPGGDRSVDLNGVSLNRLEADTDGAVQEETVIGL